MNKSLRSTLHLWIDDPSTNIFHVEVMKDVDLNLIMFKYDTVHVTF
jgi:hypothetical protein